MREIEIPDEAARVRQGAEREAVEFAAATRAIDGLVGKLLQQIGLAWKDAEAVATRRGLSNGESLRWSPVIVAAEVLLEAELSTPVAVTPEPAGPRELSVWRVVAGKPGHRGNRFRENNGALEVLGGDGVNDWLPSRWKSLDELRAEGFVLTEVRAVPPAEPGAGA